MIEIGGDDLGAPVVRSTGLRRAIDIELADTANAKAAAAKDKKDKKAKAAATLKGIGKGKGKLYGYLPMAGLFIDEDEQRMSSSALPVAFRRCWQAVWQPVISCGRSYRQAAWQLVISDLGALCYRSLL